MSKKSQPKLLYLFLLLVMVSLTISFAIAIIPSAPITGIVGTFILTIITFLVYLVGELLMCE